MFGAEHAFGVALVDLDFRFIHCKQCFVGLVLEVGISLQGHENDLLAYIDGLTSANVSGTDGVVMPMRHVVKSEERVSSLTVTTHYTKKELMQTHVNDIKALDCPIMPPYRIDVIDDDENVSNLFFILPYIPRLSLQCRQK